MTCNTCKEYTVEKKTMRKKDDSSSHQTSIKVTHFYCKERSRLILRHLMLKKKLKRFIKEQNIYLMLELLYHKPNPLITTIVYGSIF